MRKLRLILLSASLLLFPMLQSLHAMVRAGVEVDNDDNDDYYYDEDWDGPGFYFGIWFGNQGDYYNWRRGHYYYYGGHYHHDGHDHGHGGGHGGGGHHGGGGSHHGGGHH